ncbi:drebrin-like protein B [Chrysoperla carnea]|uniref:drebrin-like protein B n=1 Tax=Chrysoperla carnea TaxID=189513 RepID=UPI001D06A626|nr:drebrin-like protein B [Chrysoperla carnea]
MAINLDKNKESLKAAWKDVLNDKTDTNWAIFGYEGQTNDLKVVSTGSGGIEEMIEDLNSGKIMYAFLKVDDPKTTLPKYVLVNWQGEGANIVRKGTCANHVRDVANFFSGAHVTMNARNEEDLEPQIVIDKVAKSTGSAYSFKAPRTSETIEAQKPVGTNYQRVNPVKEINAQERNQFWLREEQEEKKRIEEERKRRDLDRQKMEEELKRREIAETASRDIQDEKRNASINEMRRIEAQAVCLENKQKLDKETERLDREPEEKHNTTGDDLRKQRNQEAQQLIGKRTSNARSIFEQNTSAGQMSSPSKVFNLQAPPASKLVNNTPKVEAPIEEPPTPVVPVINNNKQIEDLQQSQQIVSDLDSDEQEQFSTIKRSPKSPNNDVTAENLKNREIHGTAALANNSTIDKIIEKVRKDESKLPPIVTEQQIVDEMVYQDLGDDLGLRARALYDYQAADDTEITFDPGDIITHIDQIDEGWWQGLGPDGTFGLFPANYVELIF